ncbi:MAG: STAS-like domain-containing protein [Candidatus Nitrotoga sp.]
MAYPLANNNLMFSAFEIVGSHLCVSSSDGQKIYERIAAALKENRGVTLSFMGITTLTATFLNTAIGQLYGLFNGEQIRSLLKVQDMQSDDLALLKRVVETAKQYFKDLKK